MQYNSVFVDEKYSAILAPNLYGDSVLQPGITYYPAYQGDAAAGMVKIYQQGADGVLQPGAPGQDFSDTETANTLISLALNNAYRKSKKIYQAAANAVSYSLADETLAAAVNDTKEGWQTSGLACLASEGTDAQDYTEVTASNIKSMILSLRKTLRKNKANPDVMLASVEAYSAMLEVAGDKYIPSTNEAMIASGRVGTWLGMTWFEANLLNNEQAKYINSAGQTVTADLTDIDMIMYDHRAFSCVNNLEMMRLIDSEDFTGAKAQVEYVSGFKVTNPSCVAVKKNRQLDILTVTSEPGAASGDTSISVSPDLLTGHSYVYAVDESEAIAVTYDAVLSSGWTAWDGEDDITADTGDIITIAEIETATGKAKKAGSATVSAKA